MQIHTFYRAERWEEVDMLGSMNKSEESVDGGFVVLVVAPPMSQCTYEECSVRRGWGWMRRSIYAR